MLDYNFYHKKYIHQLSISQLEDLNKFSFLNPINYWGRILQLNCDNFNFQILPKEFKDEFENLRNCSFVRDGDFNSVKLLHNAIVDILYAARNRIDDICGNIFLSEEFGMLYKYVAILNNWFFKIADEINISVGMDIVNKSCRYQWEYPVIRMAPEIFNNTEIKNIELFALLEYGKFKEAFDKIENSNLNDSSKVYYTIHIAKKLGMLDTLDIPSLIKKFVDFSEIKNNEKLKSAMHNCRKSQFFLDLNYFTKNSEYLNQHRKYLSTSLSLLKNGGEYKTLIHGEPINIIYNKNGIQENIQVNISNVLCIREYIKKHSSGEIEGLVVGINSVSNHYFRDLFPNFYMLAKRNL